MVSRLLTCLSCRNQISPRGSFFRGKTSGKQRKETKLINTEDSDDKDDGEGDDGSENCVREENVEEESESDSKCAVIDGATVRKKRFIYLIFLLLFLYLFFSINFSFSFFVYKKILDDEWSLLHSPKSLLRKKLEEWLNATPQVCLNHFFIPHFFQKIQFFLNYHKQATNKLYNDIKSMIACFLLESCDSSSIHHYFNSFYIGQCFIDARRIALMLSLLRGEKHPQGTLSDLLTPLLNNLSRIYT